MLPLSRPLSRLASRVHALWRDRRGATMVILGFAMVPMTVAVGMSIDYARAARLQTKVNAIADAASLSAVTTPMMAKTSAQACATAILMFTQQVKGLDSLRLNVLDSSQFSVSVTDNASSVSCSTSSNAISTSYQRKAVVTWKGTSDNMFGGLLGMMRSPIGGSSTAQAATAPNIDFYVFLDTSGSMAIPSTSAGISLLRSKTGGCAFACHSTNDATATKKNGKKGDYYSVATSFGIPLRVDEAKQAISDMMSQAANTAQSNKATYRAALATFAAADAQANNSFTYYTNNPDAKSPTTDLPWISTKAGTVSTSLYYRNSCPKSDFCNDDRDTASSDAFNKLNGKMTNPGNGTKNANDPPQAMVILITDGMRDEYRPGGRPEVAFDTSWCSTVKARNIGIAILYTEYLPEAINNDNWSVDPNQGNVLNRLPLIEPALKSCVSRPEYYTKVTTDDDISAALQALFRTLVKTAYITR